MYLYDILSYVNYGLSDILGDADIVVLREFANSGKLCVVREEALKLFKKENHPSNNSYRKWMRKDNYKNIPCFFIDNYINMDRVKEMKFKSLGINTPYAITAEDLFYTKDWVIGTLDWFDSSLELPKKNFNVDMDFKSFHREVLGKHKCVMDYNKLNQYLSQDFSKTNIEDITIYFVYNQDHIHIDVRDPDWKYHLIPKKYWSNTMEKLPPVEWIHFHKDNLKFIRDELFKVGT